MMQTDSHALRQQAEAEAKALDIDRRLRAAARTGQSDPAAHNFHAHRTNSYGTLHVFATFGAGVNRASAQWVPADHPDHDAPLGLWLDEDHPSTVYMASDYGRYLIVFRYGDEWTQLLAEWAREADRTAQIDRAVRQLTSSTQTAQRFRPLDG
jgi:hypothetical protein